MESDRQQIDPTNWDDLVITSDGQPQRDPAPVAAGDMQIANAEGQMAVGGAGVNTQTGMEAVVDPQTGRTSLRQAEAGTMEGEAEIIPLEISVAPGETDVKFQPYRLVRDRSGHVVKAEPMDPVTVDVTPVTTYAVRYDTTTHQIQESTDGGSTWTMITGGQAVEDTNP